jgi:hypothetical protein
MKRTTSLAPKVPLAWLAAEYAAQQANAADTCDERVSDDIFDVEDERVEVGVIHHAMMRAAD